MTIHLKDWCWSSNNLFGHLIWRVDSLEKTLMLGNIEGKKRRQWERTRLLDGNTNSVDMSLSQLWETVKDTGVWQASVHVVTKSDPSERLNNPLLQLYVMESLTQCSSLGKENQEYWAAFPTGSQSRAEKSSLKNPGRIRWEHVMK